MSQSAVQEKLTKKLTCSVVEAIEMALKDQKQQKKRPKIDV
jgi:hypothetical protein